MSFDAKHKYNFKNLFVPKLPKQATSAKECTYKPYHKAGDIAKVDKNCLVE